MAEPERDLHIYDSSFDQEGTHITDAEITKAGEGAAGFTIEWMEGTGLVDRVSPETQQFFATFVQAAGEVAFKYGDDLPKRKDLLEEIAHRFAPQLAKDKRELARQVQTDKLTGLANRAALDRALEKAESDPRTKFIFIDANNFGKVNKKLSHAVGDEALKGIADHLRNTCTDILGTDERIFRRGGDEFVIIVPKDKAEQLMNVLLSKYGEESVRETDTEDTQEGLSIADQHISSRGVDITRKGQKVGHIVYGRGKRSVSVSLSIGSGDTVAEADDASQEFKRRFKKEFGVGRNIAKRAIRSLQQK